MERPPSRVQTSSCAATASSQVGWGETGMPSSSRHSSSVFMLFEASWVASSMSCCTM